MRDAQLQQQIFNILSPKLNLPVANKSK